MSRSRTVLVSGASFAGLATAFWMQRLGWSVTVIDVAEGLRWGGTPVNIRLGTAAILEKMNLLDGVKAQQLHTENTTFEAPPEVTDAFGRMAQSEEPATEEYEIERDALLSLMYALVRDNVEFVFSDTITALDEDPDGVTATFKHAPQRRFDIVLGCDGLHSNVRRLCFGPEQEFSRFLGAYGAVAIFDRLLRKQGTSAVQSDGRTFIAVTAYNGKTDIIVMFRFPGDAKRNIPDKSEQRAIVVKHLEEMGALTAELRHELAHAENFYFAPLTQINMHSWSSGRVALVGDAGYCPSPAAGMGGALAIDGAMALAEAFEAHGSDYSAAFAAYEVGFRLFVEKVQRDAFAFCGIVVFDEKAHVFIDDNVLARARASPHDGRTDGKRPGIGLNLDLDGSGRSLPRQRFANLTAQVLTCKEPFADVTESNVDALESVIDVAINNKINVNTKGVQHAAEQ